MTLYKRYLIIFALLIGTGLLAQFTGHFAKMKRAFLNQLIVRIYGDPYELIQQVILAAASTTARFPRDIETSILPIRVTSLDLTRDTDFLAGAGGLAPYPGGLLILDKKGSIYIFANAQLSKFNDLAVPNRLEKYVASGRLTINSANMRAHSIAYNLETQKLCASYTRFVSAETDCLVVSCIDIDANTGRVLGGWEDIFETPPVSFKIASMAGGGGLLLWNKKAYFAVGYPNSVGYADEWATNSWYTGDASKANSQDEASPFGKIYEYDFDKKQYRLISVGHRNPQDIEKYGDLLLSVEQGPQGGDELNSIKNGKNYGWPWITFGTRYGAYDFNWLDPSLDIKFDQKDFEPPIFSFVPSVGLSCIHEVRNFHERWNRDILAGSLKAQSIFRIRFGENRNVVFAEQIWIGIRIRAIEELDSSLVVLTDDARLLFLNVDNKRLKSNKKTYD
jgi:hypothetical protein